MVYRWYYAVTLSCRAIKCINLGGGKRAVVPIFPKSEAIG